MVIYYLQIIFKKCKSFAKKIDFLHYLKAHTTSILAIKFYENFAKIIQTFNKIIKQLALKACLLYDSIGCTSLIGITLV